MSTLLESIPRCAKIYVAGHNGLVGSAVLKGLKDQGYENLSFADSAEVDLTRQKQVESFFREMSPEYVFVCAARVGGILANSTKPASFIYENLLIEANVIHEAFRSGVHRLIFLGSSCIYPKECPQPIKEEYLLTGPLEETNRAYALTKISGIELCRAYNTQYGTNFLAVMPCNLYGPNDNFDPETSHVLPALIRKICDAEEEVRIWGTGRPRREFLYSEDLADALLFLMGLPKEEFEKLLGQPWINVGSGSDISIKELALLIANVAGYRGRFVHDLSKPDGTYQKVLEVSKMRALGWEPKVSLEEGIERMVHAYRLLNNR